MSNRQEYNQLQARYRREASEKLKQFKELNPERYAELLERAKYEVENNVPDRTPQLVSEDIVDVNERMQQLCRRIYKVDELQYDVIAKDKWGDEKRFFITLPLKLPPNEVILTTLQKLYPTYNVVEVININRCPCPACSARITKDPLQLLELYGPSYEELFN